MIWKVLCQPQQRLWNSHWAEHLSESFWGLFIQQDELQRLSPQQTNKQSSEFFPEAFSSMLMIYSKHSRLFFFFFFFYRLMNWPFASEQDTVVSSFAASILFDTHVSHSRLSGETVKTHGWLSQSWSVFFFFFCAAVAPAALHSKRNHLWFKLMKHKAGSKVHVFSGFNWLCGRIIYWTNVNT